MSAACERHALRGAGISTYHPGAGSAHIAVHYDALRYLAGLAPVNVTRG
jgi:hypothetical protein